MSGAVAAHASYNGSGTQGLAVTNKISDSSTGDVVSVFWNDNDTSRQLLYGSSTMEVPTSGSGKNASWGGSQIFTVNNDVDCVGDMYLSLAVELNKPAASTGDMKTTLHFTQNFGFARDKNDPPSSIATAFAGGASAAGFAPTANELAAMEPMVAGLSPYASASAADRDEIKFAPPVSGSNLWTLTGTLSGANSTAVTTVLASAAFGMGGIEALDLRLASLYTDDLNLLVSEYNYGSGDRAAAIAEAALTAAGKTTVEIAAAGQAARIAAVAEGANARGAMLMTFSDAQAAVNAVDLAVAGVIRPISILGNGGLDYADAVVAPTAGNSYQGPTPQWQEFFESVPNHALYVDGEGQYAPTDVATWTRSGKWEGSNLTSKVKFPLANIIKRIEFQVGTQIWQTLEYSDLLAINATELPESSYNRLGLQTSGFVRSDGQREHTGPPSWAPGAKYQAFIPLPMLTKSIAPQLENFTQHSEDGYLMAAAPHQNVKVKVHYATFADIFKADNVYAKEGWNDSAGHQYVSQVETPWVPTATLSTKLYAQHMIMCNEEREQMKNMANGIPKRLKMTQNVNVPFPAKIYPDQAITVDLDHYSIYGSHLIITASFPGLSAKDMPALKYAELKLNSSSFSGQLDGTLLKGITNKSLGLYANEFNIDKSQLDTGMGYYVFPLAARAFGGSSVPLNRFDNIRLLLTFSHPDITSSGMAIARGQINVTGVGETTGLYKAGAASLAMY